MKTLNEINETIESGDKNKILLLKLQLQETLARVEKAEYELSKVVRS